MDQNNLESISPTFYKHRFALIFGHKVYRAKVGQVRPAEAIRLAREAIFTILSLVFKIYTLSYWKGGPKGRKFLQNDPRTKKLAHPWFWAYYIKIMFYV